MLRAEFGLSTSLKTDTFAGNTRAFFISLGALIEQEHWGTKRAGDTLLNDQARQIGGLGISALELALPHLLAWLSLSKASKKSGSSNSSSSVSSIAISMGLARLYEDMYITPLCSGLTEISRLNRTPRCLSS